MICPRCHGHYESLLHRVCEARLQLEERAEGWRRTVRIEPQVQALLKLRRVGRGHRLEAG
jgi:hypothetical protein